MNKKPYLNHKMTDIANTPKPPYYAVIFTSERTLLESEEYHTMSEKMAALAQAQPGYLGLESVRQGLGITVSYWESREAIRNWKMNEAHLLAQQLGKEKWYSTFKIRICLVERDYGMEKDT